MPAQLAAAAFCCSSMICWACSTKHSTVCAASVSTAHNMTVRQPMHVTAEPGANTTQVAGCTQGLEAKQLCWTIIDAVDACGRMPYLCTGRGASNDTDQNRTWPDSSGCMELRQSCIALRPGLRQSNIALLMQFES